MLKNITPHKVALLCSIGIAAVLFFVLQLLDINFQNTSAISIGIGLFAYLLIYTFVQQYFTERIKLLYKFISTKKDNFKEEAYRKSILPPSNINQLEIDVQNWASDETNREDELVILKQSETFRKDFLANFGHEIKTPIFSVQGYIHTLKDGAINDPNVRDKFIEKASKGIDRLALLTKDLDTISNIESGRIALHFEVFNIIEIIQDVIAEIDYKCEPKNINIQFDTSQNNNILVIADKQKLKQVIINLMDNAINYGNINGFIKIQTTIIDKRSILVEISDNGIGIETDDINRVFERFYRTTKGRNKCKTGSGIGLALVKHIVEAHNQTITCRSTINVGTTFGITVAQA